MPQCRFVIALIVDVLGFGALPFARPAFRARVESAAAPARISPRLLRFPRGSSDFPAAPPEFLAAPWTPAAARVADVRMGAAPLPRNFALFPAGSRFEAAEERGLWSWPAFVTCAICAFAAAWRRYRVGKKLRVLLVVVSVGCFFFASPALAISTQVKPKPSGGGLVTGGLTALIALGAYMSGSQEDREEDRRVKEEQKKLDTMQKEYQEIDGEVTVDEDIMKSLNKRIGDPSEGSPEGSQNPASEESALDGDRQAEENDAEDDASPGASTEDIDRLKRMFELGDGDSGSG